ncbi:MAG: hypothetical protein PHI98_09395 [Eubacteriales bacterium]|nr:hypothetical protein [Eubacteriales bacterium]
MNTEVIHGDGMLYLRLYEYIHYYNVKWMRRVCFEPPAGAILL